jgi:hypothetical protein
MTLVERHIYRGRAEVSHSGSYGSVVISMASLKMQVWYVQMLAMNSAAEFDTTFHV